MTTLFQRSQLDDELWDELEELLISADVGGRTTEELLGRLRKRLHEEGVRRPDEALAFLKEEMIGILAIDGTGNGVGADGRPLVVLMVGVNGAGKTTSIAKLAEWYKSDGRRVIIGAADTFRAAAIEQLQAWGRRLEVDVIAHRQGADPGAVAFDAFQAAKARDADVVIIDTAGRLHTKFNLMEELKKIQRVLAKQGNEASHRVLLTLDATTGQNGLFQARSFTEAIKCDGVFLAKLDGTAKGGVCAGDCTGAGTAGAVHRHRRAAGRHGPVRASRLRPGAICSPGLRLAADPQGRESDLRSESVSAGEAA